MKIWEARRLHKVMTAGRTHPLVLECMHSNDDGHSHFQTMVVKAVGLPEVTGKSLFNEFFGNLLAREFGLFTPSPGLVNLSERFVRLANASALLKQYQLQVRSGLGVGCEFFDQGFTNVVPGAFLTTEELTQATLLYAFDLLIQNPDRTARKPNCAFQSQQLIAYDFEMGFSFLLPILGKAAPAWQVSAHGIGAQHVFHPALQGRDLDWQPFITTLRQLTKQRLEQLQDELPAAWHPLTEAVGAHLFEAQSQCDTMEAELQRSLL
ncbi:MAG: hypothetical protein HOP19_27185 [Acidobacteria bacterium]|nr:hypothetical protein [Acidobacteriota bacterium]